MFWSERGIAEIVEWAPPQASQGPGGAPTELSSLLGELQAAVDTKRLAVPTRRSIRAVFDTLLVAGARYSQAVQTDGAGKLIRCERGSIAKLPSGVGRLQLIRAC